MPGELGTGETMTQRKTVKKKSSHLEVVARCLFDPASERFKSQVSETERLFEKVHYFPARIGITIGQHRIVPSSKKGKVWISAFDKNGKLLDGGEFSEKKLAAVIGQFYAENF